MNRTMMSNLHTDLLSGFSVSSGKTVILLCADTVTQVHNGYSCVK